MKTLSLNKQGFCIYADTICHGAVPLEHDEQGNPLVYPTLLDAQREIAEDTITRLQQFLVGERDFEDATTVEEYVVEVDVSPDGSITDAAGNTFGASDFMS